MKTRTPAVPTRPARGSKTAAAPSRKIRFKLPYTEAREVFIAGTFNDWHPAMFPMIESRSGGWHKDLLLPPGVHEYLFVADGRWIADPGNPQTTPNPFGGVNSVLEIPAPQPNTD
jgi:1,4-alpha-glucan branching enzyme